MLTPTWCWDTVGGGQGAWAINMVVAAQGNTALNAKPCGTLAVANGAGGGGDSAYPSHCFYLSRYARVCLKSARRVLTLTW